MQEITLIHFKIFFNLGLRRHMTIYRPEEFPASAASTSMFSIVFVISPSQEAGSSLFDSLQDTLRKENTKLEEALKYILPESGSKRYEPVGRYTKKVPAVHIRPNAVKDGTSVDFRILFDDSGYKRAIYSSDWKDICYRGWLSLPNKIIQARHRLFIYSTGASSNYDLSGIG